VEIHTNLNLVWSSFNEKKMRNDIDKTMRPSCKLNVV